MNKTPHQLLGRLEVAAGHLDDDGGDEVLLPHPGLRHLHPLLGRQREGTLPRGAVHWNSCQHILLLRSELLCRHLCALLLSAVQYVVHVHDRDRN